ncbi:DgyrCDS2106 [Dimorphilus gyrociliatus]|uniref:DgyrCDS2106 n=1 Tax=Dimorphilus gyrociliatus TaxID=2664684 RepID=A0A7I8V9G8_9ANNE|nr:DgyrCDS2106 [Dimorphilus gyrociliatus]
MLKALLEIEGTYRISQTQLGRVNVLEYEVTNIEPILCRMQAAPSVLELLAYSPNDDNIRDAFCIPLVEKIVDQKWSHYRTYYWIWAIVHCSYMACISLLFLKNKRFPFENCKPKTPYKQVYDYKLCSAVLSLCIMLLTYGLTGFICTLITQCFRQSRIRRTLSVTRMGKYYVFLIGHPSLTIIWWLCWVLCVKSDICMVMETVILVTGWLYAITFSKLFQLTGFFTVMFAKLVNKDLPRFLLVSSLAIIGFGTALFATYAQTVEKPPEVSSLPVTYISLFRVSLGLTDLHFLHDEEINLHRMLLYMTFLITNNVVLLHMLIAALTDTYTSISRHGSSVWRRSQAQDILMLEMSLPNWLQLNFVHKHYLPVTLDELIMGNKLVQRKTYEFQLIDSEPAQSRCKLKSSNKISPVDKQ